MSVSVLILTLNEEINLPSCLSSLSWCDDIVVYDSFSTDRTIDIATEAGVRIYQRAFDNYASQRNAALNDVQYKHQWVMMVDADEQWPDDIYQEILKKIALKDEVTLYRIRRKDMFMGRTLYHSNGYPTWSGRLIRLGCVRIERGINEEYWTDGRIGYLQSHFIHYPFNRGIAYWLARHNQYSTMEAITLLQENFLHLDYKNIFKRDPSIRRKCLKQLAYRLPCRPLLVFIYLFFFRFGFLDGHPGLTYVILRTIYEYVINLKVKEITRRQKNLPI